ncbi:MAG: HAMP domain-containing protein [Acidobacteriota bacterium]|nr:HAMP domain-containing protein [Acidobacteriota bacterium]
MKPLPIRFKLTAWYSAVLLATFVLFGIIAFFAMQNGIETTVDEGLRDQVSGIRELMRSVLPEGPERLEDELREHSELRAGGDFSQVSDGQGRWLFRSELMKRFDIPRQNPQNPSYYNMQVKGLPLRVLSSEVRLDGQTYLAQVAAPMDDFYDALSRFRWVLLLFSPLLLVLASAGGYWISQRALKPVDEITRAAQDINSKNLSMRLRVLRSRDELQRLSETLNGMLERLEAAFSRVTRFTADASHELRTPLALMRTTAEVSLRKSRGEAEYREALAQILGESEKTTALIEKLMVLARADAGFESLERVPVNLVDTLSDVCREGRTLAEGKRITFQVRLAKGPILITGDPHALHRLFRILIDNAVKYTGPEGRIEVSLTVNPERALAEVRDTGIGIDAADLPHIFERFYRADKARSREQGGAGLGLSIAHWIADAHGGSIHAQSTLGVGSVFQVGLPLDMDGRGVRATSAASRTTEKSS